MADATADDNSNLVDMTSLENFEKSFYGKDEPVATAAEPEDDQEVEEEVAENEDDALATEEDETSEDTEEAEEEEEEKPQPKKGKKSAKERIEELYADSKEKERAIQARDREMAQLRAEIEALKNSSKNEEVPDKQPALRDTLPPDAPNPDARDEEGNLLYPLGEFDKNYIRDLTRFTIEVERQALKAEETQQAEAAKMAAVQQALQEQWAMKVEEAEQELPDLREKLTSLEETFSGIDPNYGEFLAATIMSCDNGPQIMYYLSQNIGEAQKIVASGASAATLAIGKLDARLEKPRQEEKRNTTRVSTAQEPPVKVARGSGVRTSVPGDTKDLAAFEREFYRK